MNHCPYDKFVLAVWHSPRRGAAKTANSTAVRAAFSG